MESASHGSKGYKIIIYKIFLKVTLILSFTAKLDKVEEIVLSAPVLHWDEIQPYSEDENKTSAIKSCLKMLKGL